MKKLIILPLLGLLAACNDRVGDFATTVCVNSKQFTIVGTIGQRTAFDDDGYYVRESAKAAYNGPCSTVEQPRG